ncbi:TetR/AcrR family transcriptional regulator, partial [Enterobacter sp. 63]
MARQKSKHKKIALLESATEIVAIQGLGAPTAQIAKRAGAAEGTLFRYFPTKDDLLNELFVYLTGNLGEALKYCFDEAAPLKDRTRTMWNSYIDWGIAHPSAHKAMNQLAVSEKVRPEIYASAMNLCLDLRGVTNGLLFEGIGEKPSSEFSEAILSAIAQVTITYAAAVS